MNKLLLPCFAALATTLVHAAPADDVIAAAKKLGDAPNYAWTVTIEFGNSQLPAVPSNGATEKGGYTVKYAVHAKGTITTQNGDERDIDLTTTAEIKNVGSTKVTVPEEAKKKLGA